MFALGGYSALRLTLGAMGARMEPVEINAGAWYLRALRADDRIDDRPALAAVGVDDPGYVAARNTDWAKNRGYSWAVCEPTTAEMVAEVLLDPTSGDIESRSRSDYPGARDAEQVAVEAVRRFARDLALYS